MAAFFCTEAGALQEAAGIERLPGADREKLLKKAEEALREEVARLERAINARDSRPRAMEDAIVEWFDARLRLAEVLGMRRGRPLIARLTLSVETAAQREELNRWLGEALGELEEIGTDLVRRRRWAGDDPAREVNIAPRLERLALRLHWQRAFARYWYGRTLPAGPERMRLFDKTRDDIESLLSADLTARHQWRLRLLEASCLRGRARYENAIGLLTDLARAVPEGEPEEDVLFQLALTKVEHAAHVAAGHDEAEGRRAFARAQEAVERYQTLSRQEDPKPPVDVKALMLHERLYRHENAAVDAGERERIRTRLDEAIGEFLYRHLSAAVREPAAELFLRNWDESRRDEAPVSVLALLSSYRLSRAEERLGDCEIDDLPAPVLHALHSEWEEALRLAKRARSLGVNRQRPVAPDALRTIGGVKERLGHDVEAAKAYEELSRDYSSHPLAKPAALRRMEICGRWLDEAIAGENESVRQRRIELVDALSVLLDGWDESEEADRWRMALARQCAVLAEGAENDSEFGKWILRAIRNYDEVCRDGPGGLTARFLSLQQQYGLLRRMPPQKREEAMDTVKRLQALGAALREKAAAPGIQKAEQDRLIERAGLCELYALILRHNILDETEAMERLSSMRNRLPEGAAVRGAERYLFTHALDGERFEAASELLERYEERYGRAAGARLAGSFLGDIHALLESGAEDSAGRKVRALYSRWARWLYENTSRDSPQFYNAAKFHADALSRGGGAVAAEEALAIYDRLEAADQDRRERRGTEFIDVEMAIGRARSLRTLGRPEEAIAILTPLCSGLPRGSAQFWTAQIERAECIVATGEPKALGQLLGLIRQLRELDRGLGRPEVRERFERIVSLVERKLETPRP